MLQYINLSLACEQKHYGENCEKNCSSHCKPSGGSQRNCNISDGTCLFGCITIDMLDWKIGDRCDVDLRNKHITV